MQRPVIERCRIYSHHPTSAAGFVVAPAGWERNQNSVELWIAIAARQERWRTASPDSADIALVAANLSLLCSRRKSFARRHLWRNVRNSTLLWSTVAPPKLVLLQHPGCSAPWFMDTKSWRPSNDTLLAVDAFGQLRHLRASPHLGVLVPYVVSQPAWLVGRASVPKRYIPSYWSGRKLLFVAGHIPKLYLSDTRFLLWDAYRKQRTRVTMFSSTIRCTVGQFSECHRGKGFFAAQPNRYFWSYCEPFCNSSWHSPDAKQACGGADLKATRAENARRMRRACLPYLKLNYSSGLWADIESDHRHLSHAEYLSAAMSHRFCLVPPGDTTSTVKIAEAMAIGAAGGCLPVLVLRGEKSLKQTVRATLPYSRWLDYCRVAFLVREADARGRPLQLLDWLESVSAEEASTKQRSLRAVRDAFVFRGGAQGSPDDRQDLGRCTAEEGDWCADASDEDASDYILSEACHAARQVRYMLPRGLVPTWSVPVGGEHLSCSMP